MTSEHLIPLAEAVASLSEAWAGAGGADELSRSQLVTAVTALGRVRRLVDALHAEVAAGIARESRAELGPDALAKKHGFRTPAQLIAATTGGSAGEAIRLVKLGEATAPRENLVGERTPSKYPAVQAGLRQGQLGVAAAGLIVAMLERVWVKIGREKVADVEARLVARATGLPLDGVRTLLTRAEAELFPEGVARRQDEVRAQRSLTMFERDGALHLNAVLDVEAAAPVRAAIQGFVSAVFASRRNALDPNAPDTDRRTVAMIQADALSTLCAHALGCDSDAPLLAGATIVVRVDAADLIASAKNANAGTTLTGTGRGFGTIDGTAHPISIQAVRRMAADGAVIPCVLGAESEILDWGREKRLFTRAQRLALAERDGGCAMCSLPPSLTRAHHIDWWDRDTGPTDLSNGVLLCESCHHRIHDNGWDIRIEGKGTNARVWFLPPEDIDPARTPRLGGNARYSLAA